AQEAARIRAAAQQPRPAGPALERTLGTLTQIEAALPQASAEFRAQYPQGEFAMSIHIDIRSDRAARTPVMIGAHDSEAEHEPEAPPPRDPQPIP
nr:hypothetical protein [Planctomycetota bacterium]